MSFFWNVQVQSSPSLDKNNSGQDASLLSNIFLPKLCYYLTKKNLTTKVHLVAVLELMIISHDPHQQMDYRHHYTFRL